MVPNNPPKKNKNLEDRHLPAIILSQPPGEKARFQRPAELECGACDANEAATLAAGVTGGWQNPTKQG